ncbi:MAG: helix-turn-helix domain-containing protein [Rhizobiales bacterium]|nr:helix-turn-helix domain-containing protein [Hyphomicrobiales bacterium]
MAQTELEKALLTTDEATDYLNLGKNTFLDLNIKPVEIRDKHGNLKRIRRYRVADLDHYVATLCTLNTSKENTKPNKGKKKAPSSQLSSGSAVIMNFTEALEKLPAEKRSKQAS